MLSNSEIHSECDIEQELEDNEEIAKIKLTLLKNESEKNYY